MEVPDDVGMSEWTPIKQSHFRSISRMHLTVTNAVLEKHPYFDQTYLYIDGTAGPGIYIHEQNNLSGSPIVFMEVAELVNRAYIAHFIERNPQTLGLLRKSIPATELGEAHSHSGEYQDVIPEILGDEQELQLGLIYVDPSNGIPDFESLESISLLRPRMEILLYLSATNLKRAYNFTDETLSESLACVHKDYWVVKRPARGDRHQWTFLLGSNSNLFKDYKRIGFYKMQSDEAREFFPKLDLTKSEFQARNQLRLFDLSSDANGEIQYGNKVED